MNNTYKYFVPIHFSDGGKSYFFGTNDETLKPGEYVVVDNISGFDMGIVARAPESTELYKSSLELKPVVRRPSKEDFEDYELEQKQAKIVLEITEREAKKLNLPMNFINASYTLDGSKVTINYTAENRVDFRELLRVLAPQFKCRIELHQIAPRDKARAIGGMGICGLPLCCSTFLSQFDGISISRAKNQMLTLNIPKLSGACGRLMCCLLYEDDMYTEAKKDFPRLGTVVHLPEGDYSVAGFNIISYSIKLQKDNDFRYLSLDEYRSLNKTGRFNGSNDNFNRSNRH